MHHFFYYYTVSTSNNEINRNLNSSIILNDSKFKITTLDQNKKNTNYKESEISQNRRSFATIEEEYSVNFLHDSRLYEIFRIIVSLFRSIKSIKIYLASNKSKSEFAKNFKILFVSKKMCETTCDNFILDCIKISHKIHGKNMYKIKNIMNKFYDVILYLNNEYPDLNDKFNITCVSNTDENEENKQYKYLNFYGKCKKNFFNLVNKIFKYQEIKEENDNDDNKQNSRRFFDSIFCIEYILTDIKVSFETKSRLEYGNNNIFDFINDKLEIKSCKIIKNIIFNSSCYKPTDVFQCKILHFPKYILVNSEKNLNFFFKMINGEINILRTEFDFYGINYKLHAIIQSNNVKIDSKIIFFEEKKNWMCKNSAGKELEIKFLNMFIKFDLNDYKLVIIIKKTL